MFARSLLWIMTAGVFEWYGRRTRASRWVRACLHIFFLRSANCIYEVYCGTKYTLNTKYNYCFGWCVKLFFTLQIFSIPRNPNTSENLSIVNLLAPLVLPIIILYSVPLPLLLKYLIVHTTKPLLSSGIIYQNLWEPSLIRHLILQPLVNVPSYHSHFLRPNFALISKHTFSASYTHPNLFCSDRSNRSLNDVLRAAGEYIRSLRSPVFTGAI